MLFSTVHSEINNACVSLKEFSLEQSLSTRKDKSRPGVPISSNNDTIRSSKSSSQNLAGKEPVQESKAVTAGVVVSQIPSKANVVQRYKQIHKLISVTVFQEIFKTIECQWFYVFRSGSSG